MRNQSLITTAGIVALLFFSLFAVNVAAGRGGSQIPFSTDKSDRTLIKEIRVEQKEILGLLREIKRLLEKANKE